MMAPRRFVASVRIMREAAKNLGCNLFDGREISDTETMPDVIGEPTLL
jgi:hypothetical protein